MRKFIAMFLGFFNLFYRMVLSLEQIQELLKLVTTCFTIRRDFVNMVGWLTKLVCSLMFIQKRSRNTLFMWQLVPWYLVNEMLSGLFKQRGTNYQAVHQLLTSNWQQFNHLYFRCGRLLAFRTVEVWISFSALFQKSDKIANDFLVINLCVAQ